MPRNCLFDDVRSSELISSSLSKKTDETMQMDADEYQLAVEGKNLYRMRRSATCPLPADYACQCARTHTSPAQCPFLDQNISVRRSAPIRNGNQNFRISTTIAANPHSFNEALIHRTRVLRQLKQDVQQQEEGCPKKNRETDDRRQRTTKSSGYRGTAKPKEKEQDKEQIRDKINAMMHTAIGAEKKKTIRGLKAFQNINNNNNNNNNDNSNVAAAAAANEPKLVSENCENDGTAEKRKSKIKDNSPKNKRKPKTIK